jgi:hypothetical protein
MRSRLLDALAGNDLVTSQLATTQAEVRRRSQRVRQDSESLVAEPTQAAANPQVLMMIVVGLAKPTSVPDNGIHLAHGTPTWQPVQRYHPGSMLSFVSGSAIKRITAGVKARR